MKRFRLHFIALGVVAAWAIFSYAYLGVEDGSSGLSPLGYVGGVFFLPGLYLVKTHTNANLPIMAVISWAIFSLVAVFIAQIICMIKTSMRSTGQPTRFPDQSE